MNATTVLTLTALAIAALCSSAHAQVFKCIEDGSGKITYSQYPCHGRDSGRYVDLKSANTFDGGHLRRRAQDDRMQVDHSGPKVGSIGAPAESLEFAPLSRQEICERRRNEMSRSRPTSAEARRAFMEMCLKSSGRSSGDPSGTPPPRNLPAPVPPPSIITSCDASGCWDNQGGRYNQGAGNTFFPARGGGACQLIGDRMRCP